MKMMPTVDNTIVLVNVDSRAPAPIGQLSPLEFGCFPFPDFLQLRIGDSQAAHDRFVDHHRAAGGDGPHGQLGPVRHAQLADEEDVQWRSECRGELPADGHTAPRKAQHHDVGAAAVGREAPRQDTARLAAVPERPLNKWARDTNQPKA